MSDYKALFRAAQAQRGIAKPTKEQLRALKASKQGAASAPGGPSPKPTGPPTVQPLKAPSTTKKQSTAAGLPDDFFDKGVAPGAKQTQPAQADAGVSAPAAAAAAAAAAATKSRASSSLHTSTVQPPAGQAAAPATQAPTPAGFFDDKTADAKARGVKIPSAADKEDAFKSFAAEVEEELKQQAVAEEEEAMDAAAERLAREAYEQEQRIQRLEALRAMVLKRPAEGATDGTDAGATVDVEVDAAIAAALPSVKRQRAMDVLKEGLGEESEGEEEEIEDMLNWRAKAV